MDYRIVVDSCGEFTEEMKRDPHFIHTALHLEIDGEQFTDDESFDRQDFLRKMKASPNCPKSSCVPRRRIIGAPLRRESPETATR